ncbi:hypothetical protein GCK72_013931 [Caenorhabditis remanei]|uniref:BTB domain-containing protein n=1 Tax=Caenorhabditis remanei TaxID=31234 RepID=A0A6A5GSL3_CAERE|nr:hypothetical protein GCK72_013931 [Caenorhabditis remanei]KAF1757475.1 hypothetical protein GCK72_013931 [Caenorhabditis remanei]
MSESFWKVPVMSKILELPVDSAIGERVRVRIGEILGITWNGYWTVLNTAMGQFELEFGDSKRFEPYKWHYCSIVETKFTGEGQTPVKEFMNEVDFSRKDILWKMDPFEQARKYNKLELKITRKSAVGVPEKIYINFDSKNKWLDAEFRTKDGKQQLFANSGILAFNSSVLRKRLENETAIVVPSKLFPGLIKLFNFLHPPFAFDKENVGEVLELVLFWEMKEVLAKYEDFVIRKRIYEGQNPVDTVKLAEKFKMRKLLESILWSDTSNVYNLLAENCFNTWTRAAMFDHILELEEEEEDYDDDDLDDYDDDTDTAMEV